MQAPVFSCGFGGRFSFLKITNNTTPFFCEKRDRIKRPRGRKNPVPMSFIGIQKTKRKKKTESNVFYRDSKDQ
ncbi:hypothetical protein AN964_04245 [Heyndrickxia shackletonii]|uniref:Uncharacterized protein n=1 Tax=Heyndrickxia shackletonii TaxID=157838 RepID=A0A0Q3TFI6_9BACI|nr:hypothetical protein AN964_04245 [Heyndrickxia shackletonii]